MTRPPWCSAPVVDAARGPLVGDDRLRRVMPFAATATISMIVAVPGTTWTRAGFAVAGSVIVAIAIFSSVVFPWHRVARSAQLAVPFAFLVATLLLAMATGAGVGSPFVILSILPLVWLAIYESRYAVVGASLVAGVGLWLAAPGGNGHPFTAAGASTAVMAICSAGMGITLHGVVSDARRLAAAFRDKQLAFEDAATILNSLPERVNRYRVRDHVITYCNAAWADQYSVDAAQAVGRTLDECLSEDELDGLRSQLALIGPDHPILEDPVARSAANAPGQWLQWVDQYVSGGDGAQILSIGRDVTARHDAERMLADSEARFRDLADKSVDVVWRFSMEPSPHFDYMSPSVLNILGYPPSYFLEDFSRMLAIVDDAGASAIRRALHGDPVLDRIDFHYRHANGSVVIGETRTTVVRGGLQGVSRDVTELRQLQANMAALALRDSLTGLANRRLFDELLDADLARTQRNGQTLAVAYLDLNGFKSVNDTYGHGAGDVVLCEIARRLLAIVRGADTVARVGGDEFVVVYEPNDPKEHNLVQRIDRALSAPINITPTVAVSCPASIGCADTRAVGYNAAALVAAADTAMYAAKRTRRASKTSRRKILSKSSIG